MFIGIDSALGIWIHTERSEPPYSSSSTWSRPSSVRRSASTQPAETGPTITESTVSCVTPRPSVGRLDVAHRDVDALQLGVVLDRGAPVLAPEARHLHAAAPQ